MGTAAQQVVRRRQTGGFVKAKVHRRISEAVAQKLWPKIDCETLHIATETFDWPGTDLRHHPSEGRDNVTRIMILTRRARYQYLETGFSQDLQCRLGDIFHLIQDGLISSENMEAHNAIEGQVSLHLEEFPFYGVNPQDLATEAEVFAFLRREVRPFQDGEGILVSAFRLCLSVGKAITSPRPRFKLGEQANHLMVKADSLLREVEEQAKQWKSETDKLLEQPYEEYFGSQIADKKREHESRRARARSSIVRRIISALRREEQRFQQEIQDLEKTKTDWFERSKAAKEAKKNRLVERATQVASMLQKLKDILGRGYQSRYEYMERNAPWLGIDIAEFRKPGEIESFIVNRERRLCAVRNLLGFKS